jgi:hypothetical protein
MEPGVQKERGYQPSLPLDRVVPRYSTCRKRKTWPGIDSLNTSEMKPLPYTAEAFQQVIPVTCAEDPGKKEAP